ncbi:MAG: hypothetical protein FD161_1249 [Limisphaerales bacterium]|nr:MAG: hypothetical protein FD161_1249 [Limisphaerales bacterium]
MQQVGQGAQLRRAAPDLDFAFRQQRAAGVVHARCDAAQHGQVHGQRGEGLRGRVVQLPREPAALLVLRAQQAAGELHDLRLGGELRRHIMHEHQLRAAAGEFHRVGEHLHPQRRAVLLPMPPDAQVAHARGVQHQGLEMALAFLRRAEVRGLHGEKLLPREAVEQHGRLVDFEEAQRHRVEHPHGLRAVGKESPVTGLALAERLLGEQPFEAQRGVIGQRLERGQRLPVVGQRPVALDAEQPRGPAVQPERDEEQRGRAPARVPERHETLLLLRRIAEDQLAGLDDPAGRPRRGALARDDGHLELAALHGVHGEHRHRLAGGVVKIDEARFPAEQLVGHADDEPRRLPDFVGGIQSATERGEGRQPLLRAFESGDVLHRAQPAHQPARRVEFQHGLLADPLDLVLHQDAVLEVVGRACQRGLPGVVHLRAVLRVDAGEEKLVVHRRPLGHAENAMGLGRPGEAVPRHVEPPTAEVGHGLRADERGLALAHGLLHLTPPDGLGQHVGDGLKETHIVRREPPPAGAVNAQHADGLLRMADDDAQAADHVVLAQQRRAVEPRVGAKLLHDDRLLGEQGVAGLRIVVHPDRGVPDQARVPADSGHQPDRVPLGQEFEHLAEFHTEGLRDARHRLVEERLEVRGGQGQQAEVGDDGLLPGAQGQQLLRLPALGDVEEDAVEHRAPGQLEGLGGHQHVAHLARLGAVPRLKGVPPRAENLGDVLAGLGVRLHRLEVRDGQPGELLDRVAQLPGGLLVAFQHPRRGGVQHHHPHGRALEEGPKAHLRLAAGGFRPPVLGDVPRDADHALDAAVGVAPRRLVGVPVAQLAGHEARLLLNLGRAGGRHGLIHGAEPAGRLRREQLGIRPAEDLLGRPANRPRAGGIDELVAAGEVLDEDGVRGALDDGGEQRVLVTQPLLRLPALGDVLHAALVAEHASAPVPHHPGALPDPDQGPVPAAHLALEHPGAALGVEQRLHPPPVLRVHVELPADVGDLLEHLLGGGVAVDAGHRGIDGEVMTIRRALVDALDGVLENGVILRLRHPQRGLRLFAGGDVVVGSDQTPGDSRLVVEGLKPSGEPVDAAVRPDHAPFPRLRGQGFEGVLDQRHDPRAILGVNHLFPRRLGSGEFAGAQAMQRLQLRGPDIDPGLRVPLEGADPRRLGGQPQPFLAGPQVPLGLPALRDVQREAQHADDVSVRVPVGQLVGLQPAGAGGGLQRLDDAQPGLAGAHHLLVVAEVALDEGRAEFGVRAALDGGPGQAQRPGVGLVHAHQPVRAVLVEDEARHGVQNQRQLVALALHLRPAADALERAGAVVGQGLQRGEVVVRVGVQPIALDGEHADDMPAFTQRHGQEGGGRPAHIAERHPIRSQCQRRLAQDQFRHTFQRPPQPWRRRGVRVGGWNLLPLAVDDVHGQDRAAPVGLRVVEIKFAGIPAEQIVGNVHDDAGGPGLVSGFVQPPAQRGEGSLPPLRLLAPRDVHMAADHPRGPALGVAEDLGARVNPAPRAVLVAHPKLHLIRGLPRRQRPPHARQRRGQVVGVDAAFPFAERVADLLLRVAELALPFAGDDDLVRSEIPVPQADVGGMDREPQPLIADPQRLAGLQAMERAAAVVGQRLQGVEIRPGVGLRGVALNGEQADHAGLLPDRHGHDGGGWPARVPGRHVPFLEGKRRRAQDQLRALAQHPACARRRRAARQGGRNIQPPARQRVPVQDAFHRVGGRVVEVHGGGIPAEQALGGVEDDLPGRARGDRAVQLAAQRRERQRLRLRLLLGGDVGEQALDEQQLAGVRVNALRLVPDPALPAPAVADAVFTAAWLVGGEIRLALLPHPRGILRVHERPERDDPVARQLIRPVAGQRQAAVADELDRPLGVVAAAIDRAGEVLEQG